MGLYLIISVKSFGAQLKYQKWLKFDQLDDYLDLF